MARPVSSGFDDNFAVKGTRTITCTPVHFLETADDKDRISPSWLLAYAFDDGRPPERLRSRQSNSACAGRSTSLSLRTSRTENSRPRESRSGDVYPEYTSSEQNHTPQIWSGFSGRMYYQPLVVRPMTTNTRSVDLTDLYSINMIRTPVNRRHQTPQIGGSRTAVKGNGVAFGIKVRLCSQSPTSQRERFLLAVDEFHKSRSRRNSNAGTVNSAVFVNTDRRISTEHVRRSCNQIQQDKARIRKGSIASEVTETRSKKNLNENRDSDTVRLCLLPFVGSLAARRRSSGTGTFKLSE